MPEPARAMRRTAPSCWRSSGRKHDRAAQFRCVLAVSRGDKVLAIFEGSVAGRIAAQAQGEAGFGYDPIFVPEGYQASFAELGGAVKHRLSHRARAVAQLRDFLRRQPAT